MKSCITQGRLTAVINYFQISVLYHHKGLCLAHIMQCNVGLWEQGIWGSRGMRGMGSAHQLFRDPDPSVLWLQPSLGCWGLYSAGGWKKE